MQIAYKSSPSAVRGPVLKFVFRRDGWTFRLFRLLWVTGKLDGTGYSAKLSVALQPSLFGFRTGWHEWFLNVMGLRIHFQKSFGGYHC